MRHGTGRKERVVTTPGGNAGPHDGSDDESVTYGSHACGGSIRGGTAQARAAAADGNRLSRRHRRHGRCRRGHGRGLPAQRSGNGASSLAQAVDALPKSSSIQLLEAEHQKLIVMDAAVKTMTVVAEPTVVSPTQVEASASAAANNSATSQDTTPLPAPDPGTAQRIAYDMLPSFGFSQSSQWSCLEQLWQRESSWNYQAQNPDGGAYGIPQAWPASDMASAGADYLTNPATQIRWGLGYISQRYGTPCGAWDFELANHWY
jgi:hypothetical protein